MQSWEELYNDKQKVKVEQKQRRDKEDRHKPGYKAEYEKLYPKTKIDLGFIIAWDGEGKTGEKWPGEYTLSQDYIYLASSQGEEIFDLEGLKTEDCFNLLLESEKKYKHGINVVFGGSYDFNMILRDIPRDKIAKLAEESKGYILWKQYGFRCIMRKYLEIVEVTDRDNPYVVKIIDGKEVNTIDWKNRVILWDVIGFFQSTFLVAIDKWLPKDYSDLELIKQGKAMRNDFTANNIEYMKTYTKAELKALVVIMTQLINHLKRLGLKLTRFDGAGAIAAKMMQKHGVKKGFIDLPAGVESAATYAYFGGRTELGKVGTYNQKVYSYDICSAYPSVQWELPDLVNGEWKHRKPIYLNKNINKLSKMTVVHISWKIKQNLLFYPFPFRHKQNITFPYRGEGWYWLPEILAGMEVMNKEDYKLIEAWEFVESEGNYQLYAWMKDYYLERQEMIKNEDGAEKVLKLGLNSCYGKTAQSAGYNAENKRKPPYHNLAYAGFITSSTRAKIYRAIMQKPEDVVYIATDGICSTEQLNLTITENKELGKWEVKEYQGIVIVQSGVYYYLGEDGKWEGFSRGFDKVGKDEKYQQEMQGQIDYINNQWKAGTNEVYLSSTRFITYKSALISDNWWKRWCCWHSLGEGKGRKLDIMCSMGKRKLFDDSLLMESLKSGILSELLKPRGDLKLVQTYPVGNKIEEISEKYPFPWDLSDEEIEGVKSRVVEEEEEMSTLQ